MLILERVVKSSLRNKTTPYCDEFLPGDNSDVAPPESISNSEVKHVSGDGSVGSPHVRVAHRQAPIRRKGYPQG